MIDYVPGEGGTTVISTQAIRRVNISCSGNYTNYIWRENEKFWFPSPRLEPTIFWSRVECSTDWAITAVWHMGEPLRLWLGSLCSKPRGLSWMRIAWWGYRFLGTRASPKSRTWHSDTYSGLPLQPAGVQKDQIPQIMWGSCWSLYGIRNNSKAIIN